MASRLRGLVDFIAHPIGTGSKTGSLSIGGQGTYDQGMGSLAAGFGGGYTSSGVAVNDEAARTVAAWWMGLQVISRDIASFPLITYRRNGRNRDKADDLDLYHMLHDAPNPEMTSYVFRQTLQAHLLSWGNAYAEKELDGSGRTLALWPLSPDRMKVKWRGGKRVYEYRVTDGAAPKEVDSRHIFHIPGLGFDGIRGYSVLHMARETLGQTIGLREYASRTVENDARPGIMLQHPGSPSDKAQANIVTSWDASHKGPHNAGKTTLLTEGITVGTIGMPREDLLFLTSQQWQVTEIARWLLLTPHKLNDLEHATFSNVEELNLDHANGALRGWCIAWEQQLNKDVVQDKTLFVEHNMDALLRGKTLDRAQAWVAKIGVGAAVPNEWRASDNQNPLEWGDDRVNSPNNTAPDAAPEPTPEPTGGQA